MVRFLGLFGLPRGTARKTPRLRAFVFLMAVRKRRNY
jgi:hypothetical protein